MVSHGSSVLGWHRGNKNFTFAVTCVNDLLTILSEVVKEVCVFLYCNTIEVSEINHGWATFMVKLESVGVGGLGELLPR